MSKIIVSKHDSRSNYKKAVSSLCHHQNKIFSSETIIFDYGIDKRTAYKRHSNSS